MDNIIESNTNTEELINMSHIVNIYDISKESQGHGIVNYMNFHIISKDKDKNQICREMIFYDIELFASFCSGYYNIKYIDDVDFKLYSWSKELCNFFDMDINVLLNERYVNYLIFEYATVNNLVEECIGGSIILDSKLKKLFNVKKNKIEEDDVLEYVIKHKKNKDKNILSLDKYFVNLLKSVDINNYDINIFKLNDDNRREFIYNFIKTDLYIKHKEEFHKFSDKIKLIVNKLEYHEMMQFYSGLYTIEITKLSNINDISNSGLLSK